MKSVTVASHLCFNAAFYFLKIIINVLWRTYSKMCHGDLSGLLCDIKNASQVRSEIPNFQAHISAPVLSPPLNEYSEEIASEYKDFRIMITTNVTSRESTPQVLQGNPRLMQTPPAESCRCFSLPAQVPCGNGINQFIAYLPCHLEINIQKLGAFALFQILHMRHDSNFTSFYICIIKCIQMQACCIITGYLDFNVSIHTLLYTEHNK